MPDTSALPSEFWAALIGAIVGGVITVAGQLIVHKVTTSEQRKLRQSRKDLLEKMLKNPGNSGWRKMSTLSGVIGASREETAELLIEVKARRSTKDEDVWAYIIDKPLPGDEGDE